MFYKFRQLVNFNKGLQKLNINYTSVSCKQIWEKSRNQINKQCSTEVAEDFPDIVKAVLGSSREYNVKQPSKYKVIFKRKHDHLLGLEVVNRLISSILRLALYHLRHHQLDVHLVGQKCKEIVLCLVKQQQRLLQQEELAASVHSALRLSLPRQPTTCCKYEHYRHTPPSTTAALTDTTEQTLSLPQQHHHNHETHNNHQHNTTTTTTTTQNNNNNDCHYTSKYSWLPFSPSLPRKRDTITNNAIFSFNGRRLVTSLILVITTIILSILLIVNLNCNILTEATVNTSSFTLSPFNNQTTASPYSSSSSSSGKHHQSSNLLNNNNNTTNSVNSEVNLVSGSSISNNLVEPNVLAKIKHSVSTIPGSGSGDIGTANTTTTTINTNQQQMASPSNNTNPTITNNTTTLSISNTTATTTKLDEKEDPCRMELGNQTSVANNNTSKYFDIDYAARTFEESMVDKNAILLNYYINGFKELMKFFHSLGTIFLFVTSDLETKIGLLENYRTIEKDGCNQAYLTIQSAIEYETKENLLRDSKRQSGARTILRLHRALEFLSALMRNLSKLEDSAETAPAAREAYSNTLAKHHPWTIRTIASFAMRTLPHKRNLVESVLGKEFLTNATLTNEKMLDLANVTDNLFNVVDKYYEENNIKDLP